MGRGRGHRVQMIPGARGIASRMERSELNSDSGINYRCTLINQVSLLTAYFARGKLCSCGPTVLE